jgi:hypothetical protein
MLFKGFSSLEISSQVNPAESLTAPELEQFLVIVDWDAPLLIVVSNVQRVLGVPASYLLGFHGIKIRILNTLSCALVKRDV